MHETLCRFGVDSIGRRTMIQEAFQVYKYEILYPQIPALAGGFFLDLTRPEPLHTCLVPYHPPLP